MEIEDLVPQDHPPGPPVGSRDHPAAHLRHGVSLVRRTRYRLAGVGPVDFLKEPRAPIRQDRRDGSVFRRHGVRGNAEPGLGARFSSGAPNETGRNARWAARSSASNFSLKPRGRQGIRRARLRRETACAPDRASRGDERTWARRRVDAGLDAGTRDKLPTEPAVQKTDRGAVGRGDGIAATEAIRSPGPERASASPKNPRFSAHC